MKGKKYFTDRERMETVKRLMSTQDATMHILSEEQARGKSRKFGRFDHSIVVIEYALENVGRKPIEDILPYSKNLEIA